MDQIRTVVALASVVLASGAAAGDHLVDLGSPAAIKRSGGKMHGELRFVKHQAGKCAEFKPGGYVTVPGGQWLRPDLGSIAFRVCPSWSGSDKSDHAFFHAARGTAHLTVFKTSSGSLRFAYRGTEQNWFGVDLPVADWRPGEWHAITAAWLPIDETTLMLMLKVDDVQRTALGATPFPVMPEIAFIGSRGPGLQPGEAIIDKVLLTDRAILDPPFRVGKKEPVRATIDAFHPLGPLRRVHDFTTPWNSKAVPLPFQQGSAYHRRFAEAEFRLARLVAFSDTWLWGTAVERDADGKVRLDFTDFDRIADLVRSAGADIYLRLAYNMPRCLSSVQVAHPGDARRAAYAPPKSYEEWDDMMRRIVKHCNVDRKLGVKYFVASLNEADLEVARGETDWRMICNLYARTVRVVREVDPTAKVGGPALALDPRDAGGELMRAFIRYCAENELPLDFICFHGYRKGHPREYGEMLDVVKTMVAEEYPGLEPEYFLDEFNLWMRDKKQDTEYGAAYITASQHFLRRSGVSKVSTVSFNHFLPTRSPPRDMIRRRGPYDKQGMHVSRFLAGLYSAAGEERRAILAHPPRSSIAAPYTYGCYTVKVPPTGNPRLSFATGLAVKNFPRMDGVTFRILVRDKEHEEIIFDAHQRQIPWQEREVSLQRYAGKTVEIEFRTSSGPAGSSTVADWGAWAEPRLLKGPADAPEVVYDFAARITEAQTGAREPGYEFRYDERTVVRYGGLPLLKGPVVTAPYFALQLHSMLKSNELRVEMNGKGGIADDGSAGIIASADETGIALLLWSFDLGSTSDREFHIRLDGIRGAKALRLKQYLIDDTHTNPYYDYVIAGKDINRGRYNLETGRPDVVRDETVKVDADGSLEIDASLKHMAVSLLSLSRRQE